MFKCVFCQLPRAVVLLDMLVLVCEVSECVRGGWALRGAISTPITPREGVQQTLVKVLTSYSSAHFLYSHI